MRHPDMATGKRKRASTAIPEHELKGVSSRALGGYSLGIPEAPVQGRVTRQEVPLMTHGIVAGTQEAWDDELGFRYRQRFDGV